MDPIKYLFEKPVLNGRMSRWTLMLSEFDLKYVPLKAIKGKVVADFLADNPVEETDIVDTWSFPDEDIVHVEDDVWDLYFDGASNNMGCGIGVLIISPRGEHSANKLGVMKLTVHGDSSLVINQVTGSWKIKSSSLAPYQAKIEELEKLFEEVRYVYLPREENRFADASLSKPAAMINIPDHMDSMPLCVERRSSPAYINAVDDAGKAAEPWYASIVRFKEAGEYPGPRYTWKACIANVIRPIR
ncbi:uncharacterized protein LOC141640804 [Silene latifolia]|uniref:uncharacterized protein LOC141640804 n=1 Tax=Silene latifolia TaxID=37657 RepID=UPI003D76CEC9